ncbi:MAG: glycosyltransferase family 2 protein [bacterium]|nr:glycosyltransferase family 2 protein [bacterium]
MRRDVCVVCPVHDERPFLEGFSRKLRGCFSGQVIFIDDGSGDGSGDLLRAMGDWRTAVIGHPRRLGYGAALLTGFREALGRGFRRIVTIDADLQHNPARIGRFARALDGRDAALGTRYPKGTAYAKAPGERLAVNRYAAGLLRVLFGVRFTDPFCGFRAYRDTFLREARLTEEGYGLGLEILLEIVRLGARFREVPVEAVYPHPGRRFLDGLDDPRRRLLHYLGVIARKRNEIEREHAPPG